MTIHVHIQVKGALRGDVACKNSPPYKPYFRCDWYTVDIGTINEITVLPMSIAQLYKVHYTMFHRGEHIVGICCCFLGGVYVVSFTATARACRERMVRKTISRPFYNFNVLFLCPFLVGASAEEMCEDSLNEIKAHREKQVFDCMGRGSNAWFEQRFAECCKVVEDVCHTLGVKKSLAGRHFWRNVFAEDVPPSVADTPCDDEVAANILADPDTCVPGETGFASAPVTRKLLWGAVLTAGAVLNF